MQAFSPFNAWPEAVKPPAGAVLDPEHPLAAAVVGCWLCNEGAGGRLTDCSPNGYHAAVQDTAAYSWRAAVGGAGGGPYLLWPATTSSAAWNTRDVLNSQMTRCSFELGLRMIDLGSTNGLGVFGVGNNSASTGLQGRITNAGVVTLANGNGTNQILNSASGAVVAGRYQHVVFVCGGNGGLLASYVNGVVVATTTANRQFSLSNSYVRVGGVAGGSTWGARGLDYAVMYNRVLTPEEILDRYRRPYAIAALPRMLPRFGVASSPPPPPPAYSGAVLFPCCM